MFENDYMDIIDNVQVDTLEIGDFIENDGGKVREIVAIEEDGDNYNFILEDDDVVARRWDRMVPIFGHVYKD